MKLPRRKFLQLASGAAALPFAPHVARAQAYPTRPVRVVVAFAAGGPNDIIARLFGQWLSERIGQQIIVEISGQSRISLALLLCWWCIRPFLQGRSLRSLLTSMPIQAR